MGNVWEVTCKTLVILDRFGFRWLEGCEECTYWDGEMVREVWTVGLILGGFESSQVEFREES